MEDGELGGELVDVRFLERKAVGGELRGGLSVAGQGPEADAFAHGVGREKLWWGDGGAGGLYAGAAGVTRGGSCRRSQDDVPTLQLGASTPTGFHAIFLFCDFYPVIISTPG